MPLRCFDIWADGKTGYRCRSGYVRNGGNYAFRKAVALPVHQQCIRSISSRSIGLRPTDCAQRRFAHRPIYNFTFQAMPDRPSYSANLARHSARKTPAISHCREYLVNLASYLWINSRYVPYSSFCLSYVFASKKSAIPDKMNKLCMSSTNSWLPVGVMFER